MPGHSIKRVFLEEAATAIENALIAVLASVAAISAMELAGNSLGTLFLATP